MGVRGLTTLIQQHPYLLQDYQLRDTKVVFDGNNLYYNLCLGDRYGGGYAELEQETKQFFELMKKCNLQPYVVLDGADEKDQRKLKTQLERSSLTVQQAVSVCQGDEDICMYPIFQQDVFLRVIQDMKVPYVVCDFEADDQIALLANELRCPVISDDSDFYVNKIIGGYIPLRDLEINRYKPRGRYLPVKIYFAENFIKYFPNLNDSVLPLLATVLGNDYVDRSLLEDFYCTLPLKSECFSDFCISKYQSKINNILHWLRGLNSVEQGLEDILSAVQNRNLVQETLKKSLDIYSLEMHSSFKLHDYISFCDGERDRPSLAQSKFSWDDLDSSNVEGGSLPFNVGTQKSEEILSAVDYHDSPNAEGASLPFDTRTQRPEQTSSVVVNDEGLPEWFLRAHRKGTLDRNFLSLYYSPTTIMRIYAEDMTKPSVSQCSIKLRQIYYGIMFHKEDTDDPGKPVTVTEYTRNTLVSEGVFQIAPVMVQPLDRLDKYGKIPHLKELFDLSKKEKLMLLVSSLDISDFNVFSPFPDDLKLVAMASVYWIMKSSPGASRNNLLALLVGILLLNVKKLTKIDRKTEERIRNCFGDFYREATEQFDISHVHAFAQFQSCLKTSMQLNQLLMCPVTCPNILFVFNGLFLYNFSRFLDRSHNPDAYLKRILTRVSLYHIFESWLLPVENEIKIHFDLKDINADIAVLDI